MLRKEDGPLLSVLCPHPPRRALGMAPLTLCLVAMGAVSVEGLSRTWCCQAWMCPLSLSGRRVLLSGKGAVGCPQGHCAHLPGADGQGAAFTLRAAPTPSTLASRSGQAARSG